MQAGQHALRVVSSAIFTERLARLEEWLWADGFPQLGLERAPTAAELAPEVIALSDLYTTERDAMARRRDGPNAPCHLRAKVGFFLCSDAPKVYLVLRELEQRGALPSGAGGRPLRVLDLGAGAGSTIVGLLLSLDAASVPGLTIQGVDADQRALSIWRTAAEHAAALAGLKIHLTERPWHLEDGLEALAPRRYDWILLQSVLNELFPETTESAQRIARCAEWLAPALAAELTIVIEPALREPTRILHQVRDLLLAAGGTEVLAPCLHQRACPMLARRRDWCHERRLFAVTPNVAAVQALTRRRDQRLNFSFVVLRQLRPAPGHQLPPTAGRLVSDALHSKGKTERILCANDGALHRLRLLKRDQTPANRLLISAPRGDLIQISSLGESDRVSSSSKIEKLQNHGRLAP